MRSDELKLLEWIQEMRRSRRGPGAPAATIDVGDDLAAIRLSGGDTVLLGTDMLLDGTHFLSTTHSLEQIGRKAIGVVLSDCAAMAVRPLAALVSLALPRGKVYETGRAILESIERQAQTYHCAVLGGDTTSWNGPLAIDIAIIAEPWPETSPVCRSGAQPGDHIFVSGVLGGSILGKHLEFEPRINLAHTLAELLGPDLHALIDISDGLALDLYRMCTASNCGAVLQEQLLDKVISDAARTLGLQDGKPALDHALSDGEDYELLLAVAPNGKERLRDTEEKVHFIGIMTESGLHMIDKDNRPQALEPRGFVH